MKGTVHHPRRVVPPVILAVVAVAGFAAMGEGTLAAWAWTQPEAFLGDARGVVARLAAGSLAEAARRLQVQPARRPWASRGPLDARPAGATADAGVAPSLLPRFEPFCRVSPRLTNLPPPAAA